MPISSSGPITLTDIQTEFGGANPIGLNEYYRNGAYVTPNNTGVPTSGAISMNSFLGTYKTSTVSSVVAALYNSANHATVRNQLFSRTSYAFDMEVNTATSFNDSSSASFRYATSVGYTRTWPTTFGSAFSPMIATSGITVVMRNISNGALTNSLSVNGVGQTLTDAFNGDIIYMNGLISYAVIPLGYNGIAGVTIAANFTKGSANRDNLQELFVIPGRWNAYWATAVTTGLTAGTIPAVAANDLIFTIRTGGIDAFLTDGTYSGTASVTNIMARHSRWYTDTSSFVTAVTSGGSLSFTPGRYSTTNSSGTTTYTNHAGMMVAFNCSQV
jgi:hypothetical protein